MKKIAFFVEGQTEAIFTKKLISEIAGSNGLQIEIEDASIYISLATITPPHASTQNYILIFDCQGDDAVKQKIKDNQESLRNSGYSHIIGLRDLYPRKIEELPGIRSNLLTGLAADIPTNIIISIMEIEAWFIQEYTHFTRLNHELTPEAINEAINFNPETDDASLIRHPANTLDQIYQIVGLSYKKKLYQVHLTTDHISFSEIYFVTREKKADLDEYVNEIENAL